MISSGGRGVIPVLAFVGVSGVGKTTLVEKVLAVLAQRGYRVAVVKHHGHANPIDKPGKDSWRFSEAGAVLSVVSSPHEVGCFQRVVRERTLEELVADISGVDLILAEGFKRGIAPKIEVARRDPKLQPLGPVEGRVAIVSDGHPPPDLPWFHLEDAEGLAGFVEAWLLSQKATGASE